MKIDVDIYVKNVINFFENNPNDLLSLIGDINKEIFYNEIKKIAYINYEKKQECELTRQQMIDVVLTIVKGVGSPNVFEENKVGIFCLN